MLKKSQIKTLMSLINKFIFAVFEIERLFLHYTTRREMCLTNCFTFFQEASLHPLPARIPGQATKEPAFFPYNFEEPRVKRAMTVVAHVGRCETDGPIIQQPDTLRRRSRTDPDIRVWKDNVASVVKGKIRSPCSIRDAIRDVSTTLLIGDSLGVTSTIFQLTFGGSRRFLFQAKGELILLHRDSSAIILFVYKRVF